MHSTRKVASNSLLRLTKISLLLLATTLAFSVWFIASPMRVSAAACPAPTTDLGSTTMTVSVPVAGNYRIWSRVMAPDTSNNSYSLEVDGTTCFIVGDNQLTPSSWTWVDYQNGTTSSKTDVSLTTGTHTLKLVGREANVAIDRVILVSDLACIPTGTGGNCTVDVDQTAPTVDISAPAVGGTVSGTVEVKATASDASGIAKVEFYVDNSLKATATTVPYSYSWDTNSVGNGQHTLMAKAYDKVDNFSTDSVTVNVQNGDTQSPAAPTGLTATASSPTTVDLKWNASTDNVGVTGYWVQRNDVTLAQVGNATTYKDSTAVAGASYSYRVLAVDAAGNLSQPSSPAQVTTPTPPTGDTQKPTTPTNLTATAASTSQINLKWNASTDNVGVAKYNVYRGSTKIATVTTTSFGDTGLRAGTSYTYYVTAEDAAGNVSAASAKVSTKTKREVVGKGYITGKVTLEGTRKQGGAHVVLTVNGTQRIYHTNKQGNYSFGVPAGTYKVTYYGHDEVNASDYYPQTFNLTVNAGQTIVNNVTLIKK
jgi:chitodextrinase